MGNGLSKKVTGWVARGTILGVLVAATVTYTSMQKTLVIDQDGQLSEVQFFGQTVDEALLAGNVILAESDLVYPAATDRVTNGDVITVRTAATEIAASRSDVIGRERLAEFALKDISVTIDGQTVDTVTSAPTVRDVLLEMGVVLEEGDTVSLDLAAETTAHQEISIGRASTDALTVTETLKFEVEERKDANLPKGERKVLQKGQVGEVVTIYQVELVNGVESERSVLARNVSTEPRNEIVAIGTKVAPKASSAVDLSGDSTPVASGSIASPAQAKSIAKGMVAARGWDDSQYACLVSLWNRESGWRVTAGNRSSGAYGIPQSLPGSKMASAGPGWRTDAGTQISWGLSYIKGRYKTPCGAWSHFQRKNWY